MTEHNEILAKQQEILETVLAIKKEQKEQWLGLCLGIVVYATLINFDKIIALFK
jgi:hypothetical protein